MRAEAELSRLYQQAGAEPSMEEQLEQGVKRPTRGWGGVESTRRALMSVTPRGRVRECVCGEGLRSELGLQKASFLPVLPSSSGFLA